ncbi:efflux RND transporter permease subunit [Selenomonas sp. FC4001]|uniref:efflux RND transporter permease subunit n=1 Tax=Selenomonas sp. FC4001 TaxID=1408313 RepID=UPI00068E3D55|nr:efflux RND transporter permease subunit [Selenomonas sp. FC4001]
MAQYFIRHPLQAVVLAVLLTLFGLVAAFRLPVAEYPSIMPPTVSVSATYQGADAQTVQDTVATIIEGEIRGLNGLRSMTSNSDASGEYQLSIEFAPGVDGEIAAASVQNRIATVMPSLPQTVQNHGVTTSRSLPGMVFAMSLCSPHGTYDSIFLQNYAKTYFLDKIKRVSGVGSVDEYAEDYAMRIWLQPDKLAAKKLAVNDVLSAVQEQNAQPAAGTLGKMPVAGQQEHQLTGRVMNRRETPADFGQIILPAQKSSEIVRLQDVASVAEGKKDTRYASYQDGLEAASFSISLTDSANALETISEVKKILAEAQEMFPPDMEYRIVVDQTSFIEESMAEVAYTFGEALLLVALIVYLFLGNGRATLITLLAVPVSLIATFFFFYLCGYSLNLLTLFAMILAIGLVVDDAIVIIESVSRHLERGLPVKEAASAAMAEVQAPILAIAFVLAAVFVPVAFLPGMTGTLYRQFALTLVVSMGLSAFAALSLTPALCVLLLRSKEQLAEKNWLLAHFARCLAWVGRKYQRILGVCLRRGRLALLMLVLLTAGTVGLYLLLPREFLPEEDQGYIMAGLKLPAGTSLNHTIDSMLQLSEKLQAHEAVKAVISIGGVDLMADNTRSDSGILFVALKDWSERLADGQGVDDLLNWLDETAPQIVPEAVVLSINPPAIPEMGMSGGANLQLQDVSGHSEEELWAVVNKITALAKERPEIDEVEADFSIGTPYADFTVDEDKAKLMGVNMSDVYSALQVNLGGEEVNDFVRYGNVYKVIVQADKPFRDDLADMRFLFVRNSDGVMVPLDTLVKAERSSGPASISRYDGVRSIHFEISAGEGYSSGQAMDAMEEVVQEAAPHGFHMAWAGSSRHAKEAQEETALLLLLSLVFVFLCLTFIYESWRLPWAVLLSVPVGIGGALLSELIAQQPGSIYMQIGILLVVALAAKNAILIVEFAKQRQKKGASVIRAAVMAAKLRLRPILMTSVAFIAGCLPLALASGAGSGARSNMGIAVVGGMTLATLLGVLIVPVLYMAVAGKGKKF